MFTIVCQKAYFYSLFGCVFAFYDVCFLKYKQAMNFFGGEMNLKCVALIDYMEAL